MGDLLWVVDYDIPVDGVAKRRAFYRALHEILRSHDIVAGRSTQSVWILDSEEIARRDSWVSVQVWEESLVLGV